MSATRHIAPPPFDAVVAVGSLGALQASQAIVRHLPPKFPAAVAFDLHRADSPGFTEQLLARPSALPVRPAVEGQALESATVYLLPSDRRLVLRADRSAAELFRVRLNAGVRS